MSEKVSKQVTVHLYHPRVDGYYEGEGPLE